VDNPLSTWIALVFSAEEGCGALDQRLRDEIASLRDRLSPRPNRGGLQQRIDAAMRENQRMRLETDRLAAIRRERQAADQHQISSETEGLLRELEQRFHGTRHARDKAQVDDICALAARDPSFKALGELRTLTPAQAEARLAHTDVVERVCGWIRQRAADAASAHAAQAPSREAIAKLEASADALRESLDGHLATMRSRHRVSEAVLERLTVMEAPAADRFRREVLEPAFSDLDLEDSWGMYGEDPLEEVRRGAT
jgi:hypothetical protein